MVVNNVTMNTPPWMSSWAEDVYPLHIPCEEQPEAHCEGRLGSGIAWAFNRAQNRVGDSVNVILHTCMRSESTLHSYQEFVKGTVLGPWLSMCFPTVAFTSETLCIIISLLALHT